MLIFVLILEEPKEEIFDGDIGVVRHKPKYDSGSLNRAVQRAVNDENFLSSSIKLLEGLKFPILRRTDRNLVVHLAKCKQLLR